MRTVTLAAVAAAFVLAAAPVCISVLAQEEKPAEAGEAKAPPHGAAQGAKKLPGHEVLAAYAGHWKVVSAVEHAGTDAELHWNWCAQGAGIACEPHFRTKDGMVPTTHAVLAYNPATGNVEFFGVGGDGGILRGSVYAQGNRHEWVWDTVNSAKGDAGGGQSSITRNYKQTFTFAEDGKSYHAIAHLRKGLEWAKVFESRFERIEKSE